MMKSRIKTNKIMVWIFAGLLMLCAIFVVACACNEGTGSDSEPETPVLATVEIEYGDSMSVANGSTVENQTIAVISGGTLTAVKVGETKGVIDGEEKKIKVKPATVDVVLFTGQSNMVGRETTKYTVDIPSGKAYEYKYLNNTLVSVANPVGENIKGVVEVSSGSSIVPQFCADYIERTGRKIVAVHVARGGQQIKVFAPGGNINPVLIEKYNGCLEYLTESENFTVGRKFYVMFQGESDSLESSTRVVTSKAKYKETYMAFHNSVKTSCGTEFGALIQTGRNSYISYEGIVEIAQAKNELAFENDDIIMLDQKPVNYFTNNKNYMRSDNLHYNQNGLIQIAHDSCAALTDYLGYGQSDRAGVDPIEYLPMLNDVQSFALPESLEINILKGNKATINYTFTGTELFGSDVTVQPMDGRIEWSSDDEETATVANGVITALKTGTVTITAKPLAKSTMVKTMTVNIVEQKSPKTVYRWDFDSDISGTVTGPDDSTENLNANILDAAKTPSFSSGKYTADDANSVGWKLQNKSITLNKTSDWTIEWVGQSASLSTGGNASIILAGDNENFFITYQVDRGIYIRRGSADTQGLRFMEGNSYDRSVLYESHKWELRHTESDNTVALYIDGNLINSLSWGEIDLTVTTLLGRNGSASFKGEMDYIQITIKQ